MPLNASEISKYAAMETHLHDEIPRTFTFRDSGKKKLSREWSEACDTWHRSKSPLDNLWSPEFKSSVQSGDRNTIDELITYLEVDPYYFRSAYLKGRLVRYLKNSPRTENDNGRLRDIIWNRAQGQSRAEFREYCRLASLVSTPSFRADVARKAKTSGSHSFKILLPYLPE